MSIKGVGKEWYVGKKKSTLIDFRINRIDFDYDDLDNITYCYPSRLKLGSVSFNKKSHNTINFKFNKKSSDLVYRAIELIKENNANLQINNLSETDANDIQAKTKKGTGRTKICKYCKTEIAYSAKICPQCRRKQGSALKRVIIAFVVVCIVGVAVNEGGKDETEQASNSNPGISITQAGSSSGGSQDIKEPEKESEASIEYISVTATELSDALSNNAMKAQSDYEEKYLEISGKLGVIDSNGKYIGINSDKDFDLTNIQCYIKSDEQKQVIMEMSRGDAIMVKGYCKDIGELLGYQIDIDEVTAP